MTTRRVARSSGGTVSEEEESVDNGDKSVVVDGSVVGINVSSEEAYRVEGKPEISEDFDVKMSSNEVDANSGVEAEATVVDSTVDDSTVDDSTEDGSSAENSAAVDTSAKDKSDGVGASETVEDISGEEVEAGDTYDTVVTGKIDDISDDGDASNEVGETSDETCKISDEGITASDVAAGVSHKVFKISDAEGEVSAAVDDVSVRTAKASDVVDGVSDEVEESSVEVGNIPSVVDEVSDEAEDSSVEVIMPYTDESVSNEVTAESYPRKRVPARTVSATWRYSKGRKHTVGNHDSNPVVLHVEHRSPTEMENKLSSYVSSTQPRTVEILKVYYVKIRPRRQK